MSVYTRLWKKQTEGGSITLRLAKPDQRAVGRKRTAGLCPCPERAQTCHPEVQLSPAGDQQTDALLSKGESGPCGGGGLNARLLYVLWPPVPDQVYRQTP